MEMKECLPFVISDDSGEAWVSDGSRDMVLANELAGTIGGYPHWVGRQTDADDKQRLFSLLGSHGVNIETLWGSEKTFEFDEAILAAEGKVAVGGMPSIEPDLQGDGPASVAPRWRLVFRSTSSQPLLISTSLDALGPR